MRNILDRQMMNMTDKHIRNMTVYNVNIKININININIDFQQTTKGYDCQYKV